MTDQQTNGPRLPKIRRRKLWLTSFGDMAALVLTFFILLFSISTFDKFIFQGLVDSSRDISKDVRFDKSIEQRFVPQSRNIDSVDVPPGLSLSYLHLILENSQREDPRLADMILTRRSDRLIISLPSSVIFRSGSANLNRDARRVLFHIAGLIENTGNKLLITGHTDGRPITALYPSNWELSLARAISVASILQESGITTPLDISGHSDGQQKLLSSQITGDDVNYLLARRVDIVILNEERLSSISR